MIVYGKSTVSYGNSIYISWKKVGHIYTMIRGFADIGKIDTYEFTLSDTPMTRPIIIRVSSASSFIADITASGKLGLIGNSEFVRELIKTVQKIEKERTEVQTPEEQKDKERKENEHLTPAQKAIKAYKEFLAEITEKYQRPEGDEFVKQEAYTVLKEDLDYIIGHIQ